MEPKNFRHISAAGAVLLLSLGMLAVLAEAQTLCVGPSYSVPDQSLQPPDWWDTIPPQPGYANRVDDPRWVGATRVDYNSEQASFRILEGLLDSHVYLSWRVNLTNAVEN